MKRHPEVGVRRHVQLLAGLFVVTVAVVAAAGPSSAYPGDSATGRVTTSLGERWRINATGGATDLLAGGTVSGRLRNASVTAEVTCLHIVGQTAWVGVSVTKSKNASNIGSELILVVEDGVPDVLGFVDAPASECTNALAPEAEQTVARGDFAVTSGLIS